MCEQLLFCNNKPQLILYDFRGNDRQLQNSSQPRYNIRILLWSALSNNSSTNILKPIRAIRMRRESLGVSAGGLALSGVLWATVCFLTGCCGSPMLPVYVGLLGPKFLGVTRPLTFALTLISILIGYAWMLKRAPKAMASNVHNGLHEKAGAEPGQV